MTIIEDGDRELERVEGREDACRCDDVGDRDRVYRRASAEGPRDDVGSKVLPTRVETPRLGGGQPKTLHSPFREKDDVLPDDLHFAHTKPIPLWQDIPPNRRFPLDLCQPSRLDPLALQCVLYFSPHHLHLVPLSLGGQPSVLLCHGLSDAFTSPAHGRSDGPEGGEGGEDRDLTQEVAGLPVVQLDMRVSTAREQEFGVRGGNTEGGYEPGSPTHPGKVWVQLQPSTLSI
jgi:hypothetical protein